MKLSTIVAAVATVATLASSAASAGPVGVALELSTLGFPFHHGQPVTFTVKGEAVNGMYPGITKPMKLRVKNPYGFDLKITHLAGKVIHTSRRACQPAALTVQRYDGQLPLKLKARQSKSIGSLPIHMPTWVGNECAGVTFTILIHGTAAKVKK